MFGKRSAGKGTKKALKEFKLVLIGEYDGGKNTLMKQVKIIRAQEQDDDDFFGKEERSVLRALCFECVVTQMQVLVRAAENEGKKLADAQNDILANRFRETPLADMNPESPEVGALLKKLWADETLKQLYADRDRLVNISDGSGFLWDSLDRIYRPDYVPSEQDLLRVRLRTIGYDEFLSTYKNAAFRLTDAASLNRTGRRRRNWPELVPQADAMLFVSSLCECEQRLREDPSRTKLQETLALFKDMLELRGCERTTFIVVLNKLDLFKERMASVRNERFRTAFPEYQGALEWEPCLDYVKQQFRAIAGTRVVYIYGIVATDTESVRLFWTDTRDLLIKNFTEPSLPC